MAWLPNLVVWHQDTSQRVEVNGSTTSVSCASGINLQARLVIDASGSRTPYICRPDQGPVAVQAAYGVVGRFSQPPIEPGRFVLMDYRCDHLSEEQRQEPPTFLYAMDLGDGVFPTTCSSNGCSSDWICAAWRSPR